MFAARPSRHLAFALIAASCLLTTRGEAAPRKGARLAWVRGIDAERCVGRIGLEEDVKARLGYDAFALPVELEVEGTIVRAAPSGFRAEILVRDASGKLLGSRQLASREADCRSLGEAVAVAITLAIDPDSEAVRGAGVEEIPVEAPAPPAAPLPAPPTPAPREDRAHVALTGGAIAGLVPGVAPAIALGVRALVGARVEIGVGASFVPESKASGAGFAIATGTLDACAVPVAEARALRWCAAVHAGTFEVFVHAPELAPVEVGTFPWAALGTGPALAVPLGGRVSLEASVSAVVPLLRRQAFVRGAPEPLFEQAVVAGRADLGLGATF
ncbi:MAG: hypothetical protein JST00_15540 [Deltaproteobacteria bacterium]|nr:hypothetical protein [Deltaproteobacteria bacterium]